MNNPPGINRATHFLHLVINSLGYLLLLTLLLFFNLQINVQAATIKVSKDGDLQEAINQAKCGDTINVEAGATFTGPFVLVYKEEPCNNSFITIQSSRASELPSDKRVSPSQTHLMAKLVTPGGGQSVIYTEPSAHHYKLIGLEITQRDEWAFSYELLSIGYGWLPQDELSEVPHHFIIDRCFVHGDATSGVKRGIGLNGSHVDVINSYISDCKAEGQDAQAIAGWNGPGPFRIENNYVEASGENILFGGSDSPIAGLIPSDIIVRRNHLYKPLSWKGVWCVKNLFELKNAQRVLIEGNVLENNWTHCQNGTAILFTVRNQDGNNPWAVVQDVQFINNIVRNTEGVFNILGTDYYYPSQETNNITIANNLIVDATGTFLIATGGHNIKISNNTVINGGNIASVYGTPIKTFTFQNNIARCNEFGFAGEGTAPGLNTIETFLLDSNISNNILVDGDQYPQPPGNYFPKVPDIKFVNFNERNYRLAADSPYRNKGTDGKAVGCNFDMLEAAIAGNLTTIPVTTPPANPAPVPAPPANPAPIPPTNPAPIPPANPVPAPAPPPAAPPTPVNTGTVPSGSTTSTANPPVQLNVMSYLLSIKPSPQMSAKERKKLLQFQQLLRRQQKSKKKR
jgi:hypothetical protein